MQYCDPMQYILICDHCTHVPIKAKPRAGWIYATCLSSQRKSSKPGLDTRNNASVAPANEMVDKRRHEELMTGRL